MAKKLYVSDKAWKRIKLEATQRDITIQERTQEILDFEKRQKKTLGELNQMKKGDVFRFEFPKKVLTIKAEGVYEISK